MARSPRLASDSGWYHVMNRGVDHQQVFLDDDGRVDFGRLLGVSSARHAVEVHAYCLMTNHFHLLVNCPVGGLSEFVHDLCTTYGRHVNDRHSRDGHLFRGRFHSVPVETDGHLLLGLRYIHRNPLDLPYLDSLDSYRWSSHRTYLRCRRPPVWLHIDRLMSFFEQDVDRYRQFVLADEQPRPLTLSLDPFVLIRLTACTLAEDASADLSFCRAVAALLLDTVETDWSTWLEHRIAAPTPSALSSLRTRARRRRDVDPFLDRVARDVAITLTGVTPGAWPQA